MRRAVHRRCLWALLVTLAGCGVWDGDLKQRFTGVPEQLLDGWPIATPANQGIDPAVLEAIHTQYLREDRQLGSLGFLVARRGHLVYETYFHDMADRDHVHHLMSVTKSITALVAGIGYTQGWLPSLNTPMCNILVDACQNKASQVQRITLKHLLTMRSGIAFDNVDFSMEMWVAKPDKPIDYILSKPMYAPPGEQYRYRDADPQLMGYALQALSGRTEEALAREYLFGPLDIRDYYWDRGPIGESMAAHGLHLRPRDLLKVGQLMLQQGQWEHTQILAPQWITDSTTHQTSTDDPAFGYGYLWRTVPAVQGYAAWGAGGQFILVIPDQQLVMVQISRPDTNLLPGSHLSDFVAITEPLWSHTLSP